MTREEEKKMVKETAANYRLTGELRFKVLAIEALLEFEMVDAARLVMQLPTSGNE